MSVLKLITEPARLSQLTPQQKSDLFAKLEVVQAVMNAPYGTKGDVVKVAAKQHRVSEQAVNNWLSLFKNRGVWALVDGRRKRGEQRGLSDTTRAWIFEEFCRLQREDSGAEIYRSICDRARHWHRTGNPRFAIPGFMEPPAITAKGYPEGLSYETIRKCGPDAYQKALARQGRKSASGLLPSIPSTRVGVGYLERVFFDDQKYDHYVRQPGFDRAMVPVGFNALDYLTGAFLDFHIRLRWFDTDEDTHRTLTQREFVWFVIGLLSSCGYRTDYRGTRLVFEHGTANSWNSQKLRSVAGHHSFDDALHAFTDQHVTIDRSGKFNEATYKEMLFKPQSAGNFRYKAPIETMFRAVRTHGLLLPGPTGRNPDFAPEESYGLQAYERSMARAFAGCPQFLVEAIKSELFSFLDYSLAYRTIYAGINASRDHGIEGWEKCGFTRLEWRWPTDEPGIWRGRDELAQLATVDENRHAHALALFKGDAALTRTRRMSRTEAVRASEDDPCIRTLDPRIVHNLLPIEWAQPITVNKRRELCIKDPLIRAEEAMVYSPRVKTATGHVVNLSPGDAVLCHLNPFRPDTLIVCDQDGVMIGTAHRIERAAPSNSELAHELLAERAMLAADLDAPVRMAFQTVADRRREMQEHNADLLARAKEAGFVAKPADTPKQQTRADERRNASATRIGRAVAASRPQESCTDDADEVEDWSAQPAFSPEPTSNETEKW